MRISGGRPDGWRGDLQQRRLRFGSRRGSGRRLRPGPKQGPRPCGSSVMIALTLAVTLGGSTPPALVAPSRIVYVSADISDGTSCRLLEGDQWTCQSPSAQLSGIVVIVGQDAIAYRSPTGSDAS